jgi:hypothetical protein
MPDWGHPKQLGLSMLRPIKKTKNGPFSEAAIKI